MLQEIHCAFKIHAHVTAKILRAMDGHAVHLDRGKDFRQMLAKKIKLLLGNRQFAAPFGSPIAAGDG